MSERARQAVAQVVLTALVHGVVALGVCSALAIWLRPRTDGLLVAAVIVFALVAARASMRGLGSELCGEPDRALPYYAAALADVLLGGGVLVGRWLLAPAGST